MSLSQPLAVGRRSRDEEPLVGSCTARVLILIDIAELPAAAEKRANGAASGRAARAAAAGVVDGLRLSVLRVLTQLCLSCPANSWVEWAPRFFDSRPGGVGKTPAELRARLRSRQVPQGVRGFRKVTQASFTTFGDACLAMACGVLGDPLARDRETALRRWAHGQKKHPAASTWTQPRASEPGACSGPGPVHAGDSREDVSSRMYAGHDMSSHEVVVRSLLEVLQEFDDATEGDRTAAPSIARGGNGNGNTTSRDDRKLQLLLLHSALPRTDEDAEQFALRGNFTTEAATINKSELPETRATALDGLLNAQLGKAVARAGSRGVSFLWQEGGGHHSNSNSMSNSNSNSNSNTAGRRDETGVGVGPNRRGSCLQRCLSAAGASGVLHWERVVGSTGLLPPSAALGLGRQFGQRQPGDRWRNPRVDESDVAEGRKGGAFVAVALNRRGDVDVHLVASIVSGAADSTARDCQNASGSAALLPAAVGTATATATGTTSTPWRLMGTVPIAEVWPSCLVGQGWGTTRILCADSGGDGDGDGDCGRGAQLWREFLGELVAEERAGVITLPQQLFGCDTMPNSDDDGDVRQASSSPSRLLEALAVALVVPISDKCAVCFSTRRLAATLAGEQESGAFPRATSTDALSSADERGSSGDASGELAPAGHSCGGDGDGDGDAGAATREELAVKALKMRGMEVGLAMQESALARKRRRQAKSVPGKGSRGMKFPGSSIAGVEDRGGGAGAGSGSGGGHSGSLSQRDSGSLCFTGEREGTSGDGAACDVRQWRLEMEMASVTSSGSVKSASPRGYRLFNSANSNSTPGGAIAMAEEGDDEQMSSTGSSSLSGPKRALYQALEDVSSRSSLLGPDADSSSTSTSTSTSTPGSKEGSGWSGGAPAGQRVDGDATASRNRGQSKCVFPAVDDAAEVETDLSDVVDADFGAGVLPLSLMSEPALACLPGPALPVELVALAERCSRSNQTITMAAAAAAAVLGPKTEGTSGERDSVATKSQTTSSPRRVGGARQRFIDAVRSSERARQAAAAAATPAIPAEDGGTPEEAVPAPVTGDVHVPETPAPEGGEEETQRVGQSDPAKDDVFGTSLEGEGDACLFEEGVGRGVAGLQMQYREVVESGQRSPVDFVVCSVPEAIRDMVDGGNTLPGSVGHPTNTNGDGDTDDHDRDVRAAQVLAAVVSGLTSTPKELSSKHRANRSAGASASGTGAGTGAAESGAGASTAAAKPAVQKIRDYQLQALLLCQLNSLAMDLPEAPESSLKAFSSLAASEMGDASGDASDSKSKKGKGKGKGKGKRKKRRRKETAPTRPCDPLPDCRRARLVDYLQPISTMLDACTVTKPPQVDDGGGGGASADGEKAKGKGTKQSRAYDGTLADFMGLALVEHFCERLPRTLAALFEDFERHPPDALTAALTGTPTSAGGATAGGAVAAGSEAGGGPSKEAHSVLGGAPHAPAAEEPFATGRAPKNDVALSSSRGSTYTAGILLSDRTSMSHNHFKMSGVLNGYREVKLKGHAASGGGLRPSVLGKVNGNGQGGRDANGSAGSGESEEWRTSNGEGKGMAAGNGKSRRGARSRATRDSKASSASASASASAPAGPARDQQSPASKPPRAAGIRQSPRLNRKRPSGDGDDGDRDGDGNGTAMKSVAGSKRRRPLSEAASASPLSATASAAATPGHKRRLAAVAPGGGAPAPRARARARATAGVLVGETPQKRPGGGVGFGGAGVRSSGRRGGRASTSRTCIDEDEDDDANAAAVKSIATSPTSPAASGSASRTSSKRRVAAEARVAGSPSFPMSSPSAGPKKRRRAIVTGPASPAESLFVAESPGVSTGSVRRRGRSGWATGAEGGGDVDGVSRQLMAESASPVGLGRRRGGAVVPDTPA